METETQQTASQPSDSPQTAQGSSAQDAQSAAQTTAQQPQGGDADAAADAAAMPQEGGDKPFLGDQPKGDANGKKDGADGNDGAKDGDRKDADAPKPPSEDDYLKAVVKDESVLGRNDNLVFDQRLVKAVIPTCQKYGISTDAAKDLANAFAKAQVEGAREAMKERCDRFAKMNGEARAKYSDADFGQINKGIDACFKPGGVMNFVVRNSELGADPEFLALMHRIGAERREDTVKGAGSGGGDGGGDPNGIGGISRLW